MDFVSDQLFDGRRVRVLVIVDTYIRESLAFEVSQRIRGLDVVTVLERIGREHDFPRRIQVDNGPEFISKDLDRWAYWNYMALDFSRPGKPTDNTLVEAFNSRFRQECLNQHWYLSLEDAQQMIAAWSEECYTQRPHSALDYRSPAESTEDATTSATAVA